MRPRIEDKARIHNINEASDMLSRSMDFTVSFIIPAYNPNMEFFRECVQSIIDQTWKQTEIIVVDDGSKEDAASNMDLILDEIPNAKILHLTHGGVSVARNKGMDIATGKYLMFVDADDCVDPKFTEMAVSLAEKENVDIVYGIVKRSKDVDEEFSGNYITYDNDQLWMVQEGLLCPEREVAPIHGRMDHGPCAKLYRRVTAGVARFPEGVTISEDQVFVHEALKNSTRCVVFDALAYYYRRNAISVSHSCHADAIEVMAGSMELVKDNLVDESKLDEAFQYRMVDEMRVAFLLTYLNSPSCYRNMRGGLEAARRIVQLPLMDHALSSLPLRNYRWKFSVQAWLLKHGHLRAYVVLEWLIKFRNRKRERGDTS